MSPKSRNLREAPSGKRGTGSRRGGGRGRGAADTRGSAKANAAGVNRAERRARPSSPALIAQTTSGEWTNTPVRWCPLNSPTAALMGGAPIPCDGTEKPFSAAVARPGAVVTGKILCRCGQDLVGRMRGETEKEEKGWRGRRIHGMARCVRLRIQFPTF